MSSLSIPERDKEKEKMRILLKHLSLEQLDREEAMELKPLLMKESQVAMDLGYRKVLFRLMEILDKYIAGEVNLSPDPIVKLANVV
jgi:hypothetical protein